MTFLWSLACRPDIELFWIGDENSPADPGRVLIDTGPPGPHDHLGFSTVNSTGGNSLHALWPYEYLHTVAYRDATDVGLSPDEWLTQVLVAQTSVEMNADILVTMRQQTLFSQARYITEANPLSAEQALSVVGLYLRSREQYPIVAPKELSFNEHKMLAVAVEGLLPSWRTWTIALSMHGSATGSDSPQLLAHSLKERIIRLLRCRDQLLIASLAPQTNTTADRVAESLDYLLVNLVGAFDAAARAAHLVADLSHSERRVAAWQRLDWVKSLQNDEIRSFWVKGGSPAVLFWVCRVLRNTVHGESMQTIAMHEGLTAEARTLVRLPADDAEELAGKFDLLGGGAGWGLRHLAGVGVFIDASVFVERLLPQVLNDLDEVLRLTPTSKLDGVDQRALTRLQPNNIHDGLGTRSRVGLLLGLPMK
ncbi:hypothetical protein LRQ08_31660 (plasmid) [Rhodococcus qingshengii]|uniref:hypothetical protein n=1 Tax=Rhodococcus qingshengii TaxID=334542 RepID=UPI002111C065|nr:hypothetical protein [Rhodococcus qingshengii]UUE28492.1 hypothetical protein LRQ08_31660 [Rhodococcus qingshengii]